MPRKFAEMLSKFRFGQEFIEKLGILSNFVDRCLHYFCTILDMKLYLKDTLAFQSYTMIAKHLQC